MNILRNMRQVLFHPLDFFYDIQFNNRSKWHHAVILLVLTAIVNMLNISWTGYSFEGRLPYQVSVVFETFWILLPWVSWCISNWAVSAILEGEGKFKDIVVSAAYALAPYIVISIPLAIVSRVFTLDERVTYLVLLWVIYIWVALLFLIKVKTLHDFELGKVIWITFLTLIGMLIIWFVTFLVFGLINQVYDFIIGIIKEVQFRL